MDIRTSRVRQQATRGSHRTTKSSTSIKNRPSATKISNASASDMAQTHLQPSIASSPINHFRLMDLSPELRNQIYEMAFAGEFSGEGRVDMCASRPPSCALLQASRQVHQESKQIFVDALRTYYEHSKFFMTFNSEDHPRAELSQIASRFDLQKVRNVRVVLVIPHFITTGELVWEPDQMTWAAACHPRGSQGPGNFDGFAVAVRNASGAAMVWNVGSTKAGRDHLVEIYMANLVVGLEEQVKVMVDFLLRKATSVAFAMRAP
ncbi:hypothetical protein AC579_3930 [Pseudocercospora musae]|uniref:Uncharacterized protein n=1 Tax=Pseudocercospora musae TaxID=113226 RepID=A0A139IKL6_9PEZI|nr:hypothetical protein AC579_3930 [Pseudocercospora musae]